MKGSAGSSVIAASQVFSTYSIVALGFTVHRVYIDLSKNTFAVSTIMSINTTILERHSGTVDGRCSIYLARDYYSLNFVLNLHKGFQVFGLYK